MGTRIMKLDTTIDDRIIQGMGVVKDYLIMPGETIAVLDDSSCSVAIYRDGEVVGNVVLSHCVHPIFMESVAEYYIILDDDMQKLMVYNQEWNLVGGRELNPAANDRYIYMGSVGSNIAYIETIRGVADVVTLNGIEIGLTPFVDKWDYVMTELPDTESICGDMIYESEGDRYYIVQEQGAYSVRRYNGKSEVGRCDITSKTMLSPKAVRFNAAGEMNLLYSTVDEICIEKQTFGTLQTETMEAEMTVIEGVADIQTSEVEVQAVVSVTRQSAVNTAMQYTMYPWTITQANQHEVANSELPGYIAALDLSSGSVQLQGLPYCWGGWNTLAEFTAGINGGGQAGNIIQGPEDDEYYKDGTYGVDCSGLICRAYNLSAPKRSVEGLAGMYSAVTYDTVCSGDILTKSGHVMMYYRMVTTTSYTIIDSTTENIDKVTSRVLTRSLLDSKGYTPRTGWTTNHQQSTTWSSNSQYHWRTCANGCGKKYTSYAHTFVQYTGYKKCSVCGYQTS